MRIYLMTDMEGVSGIENHDDWVIPSGPHYDRGRELLTREANAAIEGFFQGGAKHVLVVDGHGAGGLLPELLHPDATLAPPAPNPPYPFHLEGSYDGLGCVGQHAKSGTPYSHLTHTQSFEWLDLTVNGVSIGEYGQMALCGMALGVPAIFAAGEVALAAEAEALTPGVITAGGKRGLEPDGLDDLSAAAYAKAKLGAKHLPPAGARRLIQAAAKAAAEQLERNPHRFRWPSIRPPYELVRKLRTPAGQPPQQHVIRHDASIIDALNTPWQ